MLNFLQTLPVAPQIGSGLPTGVFVISGIIYLAIYIYVALALMALAKKTQTQKAWLAFIPIANLYLMAKMAQMHWWPILLIIGFIIPFLNFVLALVLTVYTVIWFWKIFTRVGRPGWWAIFSIIPFVNVVFLVFLGIAAWGNSNSQEQIPATQNL